MTPGTGYDAKRCLEVFDLMEIYAINFGDLDIVYGPDDVLEAEEKGSMALFNMYTSGHGSICGDMSASEIGKQP